MSSIPHTTSLNSQMEKEDHHHHQRELQLLPPPSISHHQNLPSSSSFDHDQGVGASDDLVDLRLSICSLQQITITTQPAEPSGQVAVLRWQAAEQTRMAAMERAYVEQVRELTRREMEIAQAELARARLIWETATEEVAKAHFLREAAIVRINQQVASSVDCDDRSIITPNCFEITCHSCRQRFRP